MLTQVLLALVASASAATIKINVGEAGLTFTPDTTTAEVGDVLEFHFVGGVHDTVRGDFDKPCQPAPAEGGWASGSITGSATNKDVFRVTVNTTEPLFYYCSVGAHCPNGMVAAVNPTADLTVAAYKAAAKGKTATRPTGVFGGEFGDASAE